MLKVAACGLCLGLLLSTAGGTAGAETVRISFEQLEELARTQTPGGRIADAEYRRTLAERDENLQWSNPELAYDREDAGDFAEYQVTIGKTFAMPWAHLKKRSAWQERIRAAGLTRENASLGHLAELKAGYVKVWVHQQYLSRLEQLREILTDASQVAAAQYGEGHISGVEDHLIQMSVISLNASYQEALQEQREAMSQWRAALGYSAGDSLVLATEVDYREFKLQPESHYMALVESHPGVQARATMREALAKQASASRAALIPSFNVYGGYKKIDPDFDGYTAGVSVSVPLFNRNGAEARQYEAESTIAGYEEQLYRTRVAGAVATLTRSIAESQGMLAAVAGHFEEDLEALDNILFSYEEGWMTLSELLNAIQVETDGLSDYYDQLIRYYENLFALESLTGEKSVTF